MPTVVDVSAKSAVVIPRVGNAGNHKGQYR